MAICRRGNRRALLCMLGLCAYRLFYFYVYALCFTCMFVSVNSLQSANRLKKKHFSFPISADNFTAATSITSTITSNDNHEPTGAGFELYHHSSVSWCWELFLVPPRLQPMQPQLLAFLLSTKNPNKLFLSTCKPLHVTPWPLQHENKTKQSYITVLVTFTMTSFSLLFYNNKKKLIPSLIAMGIKLASRLCCHD